MTDMYGDFEDSDDLEDNDDDIGALGSILSWDDDDDAAVEASVAATSSALTAREQSSSRLPDLISSARQQDASSNFLYARQNSLSSSTASRQGDLSTAKVGGVNVTLPMPSVINFSQMGQQQQQMATQDYQQTQYQHQGKPLETVAQHENSQNAPCSAQNAAASVSSQSSQHGLQQSPLALPPLTQQATTQSFAQTMVSSTNQEQAHAAHVVQAALPNIFVQQQTMQPALLHQQQAGQPDNDRQQQLQHQMQHQLQQQLQQQTAAVAAAGQQYTAALAAAAVDPASFFRQLQMAHLQQHFNNAAVQQQQQNQQQLQQQNHQQQLQQQQQHQQNQQQQQQQLQQQQLQQQQQQQQMLAFSQSVQSAAQAPLLTSDSRPLGSTAQLLGSSMTAQTQPVTEKPPRKSHAAPKNKKETIPSQSQSQPSSSLRTNIVSASDTDGEFSMNVTSNDDHLTFKDDKESYSDLDLSDLNPDSKAKVNRDRNREHARNTRLRKKAYLEKLKVTVDELCRERDTLVQERAGAAKLLVEMHNTRTEVLVSFFALRSTNERRRELWSSILDESCFACLMPVTPYRSFPASEVQVSKCQRTILGIDGMMSDTASLHVLINSLVDRSRFPSTKIELRYTLVTEEAVVAGNQLMARWVMTTINATECGARMEVAKQGMLCCKFNSAHKIVGLELMFDVMAFMLQLKQAAGSDTFSVIPNTVQTCQRSFDKPMIMTLAERPYTIIQVNKLWEEMTGYTADDVVGKASCRILQGHDTNRAALEALMCEVRFKRPAASMLLNYKKSGEAFRNFFVVYPLSTDSKITHFLSLTTSFQLDTFAPCGVQGNQDVGNFTFNETSLMQSGSVSSAQAQILAGLPPLPGNGIVGGMTSASVLGRMQLGISPPQSILSSSVTSEQMLRASGNSVSFLPGHFLGDGSKRSIDSEQSDPRKRRTTNLAP